MSNDTHTHTAQIVQQQLPSHLQKEPQIAEAIADLIAKYQKGNLSTQKTELLKATQRVVSLLRELEGSEIQVGNTAVSFGDNAQTGDISIRDIVYGNAVHVTIQATTFFSRQQLQTIFALSVVCGFLAVLIYLQSPSGASLVKQLGARWDYILSYMWQTVIAEDFSNPEFNWSLDPSIDDLASVQPSFVNEKYQLEVTTRQEAVTWPFNTPMPTVKDFFIQVDTLKVEGPPNSSVGVFFRFDKEGQAYRLRINPVNKTVAVLRYANRQLIYLLSERPVSALKVNEPNEITIISRNNNFHFFINGEYIESIHDDIILEGDLNFAIGISQADKAIYQFDNVIVRIPD